MTLMTQDSLNETLKTSWMICRNPVVETGRYVQKRRGHCSEGSPTGGKKILTDSISQWPADPQGFGAGRRSDRREKVSRDELENWTAKAAIHT